MKDLKLFNKQSLNCSNTPPLPLFKCTFRWRLFCGGQFTLDWKRRHSEYYRSVLLTRFCWFRAYHTFFPAVELKPEVTWSVPSQKHLKSLFVLSLCLIVF